MRRRSPWQIGSYISGSRAKRHTLGRTRGGKLKVLESNVAVQVVYLSPFESRKSIANRIVYLKMVENIATK